MKLTEQDIAKSEIFGQTNDGPIFHILTKGGLSILALKKSNGELEVLSSASLPAIARVRAENVRKDIQWDKNLFKSENVNNTSAPSSDINVSTSENHYNVGKLYSMRAGQLLASPEPEGFNEKHHRNMMILFNTDNALKQYELAGMTENESNVEHKKNVAQFKDHDMHLASLKGYDDKTHARLVSDYQKKNGPKRLVGLGYNWTE